MRKKVFGLMSTVRAKNKLHVYPARSGPFACVSIIFSTQLFCKLTVKVVSIQDIHAVWSGPLLNTYIPKTLLTWHDSHVPLIM